MSLRLGTLTLASPFILSPMESVSDAAFRRLCWEQGAGFTWTEMIRARGIVRNNKSTLELVDSFDPEVPTGVQLFVVNEEELTAALARIEALADTTYPHFRNVTAVDLNFGCPSPEVIRVGAGPALLKRRAHLVDRDRLRVLRLDQHATGEVERIVEATRGHQRDRGHDQHERDHQADLAHAQEVDVAVGIEQFHGVRPQAVATRFL